VFEIERHNPLVLALVALERLQDEGVNDQPVLGHENFDVIRGFDEKGELQKCFDEGQSVHVFAF